jgi:hypothetical protein
MTALYLSERDPWANAQKSFNAPATRASLVTPSDSIQLARYAKMLRVYVPSSIPEASVKVTPLAATDDSEAVTLTFTSGLTYELIAMRKVWATGTTSGIIIHALTE